MTTEDLMRELLERADAKEGGYDKQLLADAGSALRNVWGMTPEAFGQAKAAMRARVAYAERVAAWLASGRTLAALEAEDAAAANQAQAVPSPTPTPTFDEPRQAHDD